MTEKAVLVFQAVTPDNLFIHHHLWFDQGYMSLTACLWKKVQLATAWAYSEIIYLECLIQ